MQMRHIGFCSASQMINKFYEKKSQLAATKKEIGNKKWKERAGTGTGTWDDAEIKRKMQSSYLNLTTESKQMRRKVSNNL